MKTMRIGVFTLIAHLSLIAPALAATAAAPSLYGVTIGKPLSLPRCSDDPMTTGRAERMCWWNRDGADQQEGDLDISFGPSFPVYLYSNLLMVRVVGGVVVRIAVTTDGAEVQHVIASLLKQKFGVPSAAHVRQLQNGFGARYNVLSQRWTFKTGADLRFEGTLDDIERGSIIMRGPTEIRIDNAAAKGALGPAL